MKSVREFQFFTNPLETMYFFPFLFLYKKYPGYNILSILNFRVIGSVVLELRSNKHTDFRLRNITDSSQS